MSYVLAAVGFALLVLLHEAGHFAAAKAVGMRVERFSLFFGPLLLKVRRGETEYGIGPIPLGGYVKITGMNPNEEIPPEIEHRAYYRQPAWKRIVVIVAGPAVNLVLAFGILFFVSHHTGKPVTDRHGTPVVSDRIADGSLAPPAAGTLRAGDRILSVDGRSGDAKAISQQIASHRCPGSPTPGCQASTPARVTVGRDGRRLSVSLTPRYDPEAKRTRVGFGFDLRTRPVAWSEAAGQSVSTMWHVTTATLGAIGHVFVAPKFFEHDRGKRQVGSVVGGFKATQQSFAASFTLALQILALISLSLGVVNLFPFLPLDGGHIFWALAEKVRGRSINFGVLERASVIGFMLVIFVFLVGLSNDISTLSHGGFAVR